MRSHPGVRKDSSGYALADYARSGEIIELLIGSEGTLALFVGIELSIAPLPGVTSRDRKSVVLEKSVETGGHGGL
mgnify:CR=1 FL=1